MTVLLREDAADFLVKSRPVLVPPGAAIDAMGKVLEGRGHEPVSKDALAADEPTPGREPSCATCGRIFPNRGAYARHRIASGHGSERERTPNEQVAANPGYDEEPLSKAARSGVIASYPKKRHTLVAVTPDRFGTDPQSFQNRVWDGPACAPGRTSVTGDDGRELGRVVEVTQWPFDASTALAKAAGGQLPANSYYVGVLWKREAWADIEAGRLDPIEVVAEALTA